MPLSSVKELRKKWIEYAKRALPWFREFAPARKIEFYRFTLHDESHSKNVERIALKIADILGMNELEKEILRMAAWGHDISLSIDFDETVLNWLREKYIEMYDVETVRSLFPEDIVRSSLGILSVYHMRKYLSDIWDELIEKNEKIIEFVEKVMVSHSGKIKERRLPDGSVVGVPEREAIIKVEGKAWKVRPLLIAGILRLADLLDIEYRRLPWMIKSGENKHVIGKVIAQALDTGIAPFIIMLKHYLTYETNCLNVVIIMPPAGKFLSPLIV